ARALRPGGRLVLCSWQGIDTNPWFRELAVPLAAGDEISLPRDDAPGPFGHADPDRVTRSLVAAELGDVTVAATTGPLGWGANVVEAEALAVALLGWRLKDSTEEARTAALGELRATLAARHGPDGVVFPSASWLVRARRL